MKNYKLKKILYGGAKSQSSSTCEELGFDTVPSIVNTDREKTKRIIAIGDIHGDLDLAIKCLEIAQVIKRINNDEDNEDNEDDDQADEENQDIDDDTDDENDEDNITNNSYIKLMYKDEKIPRTYKWIATNTIVVQVGDQVDRCRPGNNDCTVPEQTFEDEASDITILFFFHDLHLAALKSPGCAVYSLLGNHELMNVLGNLNYVSYKGLMEFNKQVKSEKIIDIMSGRKDAFKIDSEIKSYHNKVNLANFLACSRISSLIIDKYLFVHAGLLEKLVNYTLKEKKISKNNGKETIAQVNNAVKKWLLNASENSDKAYINKLLVSKSHSPFWPRIYGSLPSELNKNDEPCKTHVNPVLNALDVQTIVVGHTPQLKDGISNTCSQTVWRIDVASSKAFNNIMEPKYDKVRKPQVLEINFGKEKDTFKILS